MIEKILERLNAEADKSYHAFTIGFNSDDRAEYDAYIHATEIVQSVAQEYGDGWIPCSERLPEDDAESEYYQSVNVTLDSGRVTNGCYRNKDGEWWVDEEDGEKYSINATGHVLAWQPLPSAYQPKGE